MRNPELEVNLPDGEWAPSDAIETAVRELTISTSTAIRTVVDLTVPGLGRDVRLVAQVAERVPVNLIAATGWYTPNVLPTYLRFHGPGRTIDTSDPLVELFVSDIHDGIAGGTVRAGMLKVVADEEGCHARRCPCHRRRRYRPPGDRRDDHDPLPSRRRGTGSISRPSSATAA